MAKMPDEIEVKVRAVVEMVSDRCEWEIARLRRLLTDHGIDPDQPKKCPECDLMWPSHAFGCAAQYDGSPS